MTEAVAQRLVVATFARRPDLLAKVFEPEILSAVPEFMRHDPAAALYYGEGELGHYLDYGLVAVDPTEPDRPVARAFSVPFAFPDGAAGQESFPDGGWDEVIRWAYRARLAQVRPTAVSALEIMVAPGLQGQGVARVMLAALRANARRLGFAELYAPLRPTDKQREPLTPFADYVARRRDDGLPHDSWVRTHLRLGARILKVASCSMVIRRDPRRVAPMDRAAPCPNRPYPGPWGVESRSMSRSSRITRSMSSPMWVRHPLA